MRTKEVWDKILPLALGTRARFIKNRCKLEFKTQEWFKAREKNLGNEGSVDAVFPPNHMLNVQFARYFSNLKDKNIYSIHFDKPVGDYVHFYCTREELEII